MKIAIAAMASLAFATSAIAAVSSAPAEKQPTVNITGQFETAHGGERVAGGYSSRESKNTSKAGSAGGGKQNSWK
ncbi:hypothetical protein BLJAPNOD_05379 [Ensifer sp. M14]|jgi:hypothetical protein|uniref:hypothetical protein n=1 Tax=Sinorhizobium/Ensifer group TaxID=227292 RepID=UPI000E1CAAAF|nr:MULTISPECIES: hypothetical protein [Sinorhizobium/Ensifer group]RDL47821.1 hypothetical protein BLJAPNOD_05379 [Ensifer sp. M14]